MKLAAVKLNVISIKMHLYSPIDASEVNRPNTKNKKQEHCEVLRSTVKIHNEAWSYFGNVLNGFATVFHWDCQQPVYKRNVREKVALS